MAPFKFSSNSRAVRVGPLEGEPQAEVGVPLACVSRENNPQKNEICLLHLEDFLIQIGATQRLPGI